MEEQVQEEIKKEKRTGLSFLALLGITLILGGFVFLVAVDVTAGAIMSTLGIFAAR